MATKQGDFLLLNYTLKVKEDGKTVDTTYEAIAKTAHIHHGDESYGPKFVILGEGWIPKGLEERLLEMDAGTPATVELPADKGYGARDPAKMRLVPLRKFREQNIDPQPGRQVELDGRPAVVRAVGAGRVQVDYNHPLAGRTLIYDVSVEKVLEDENEKILNVISVRIPEVDKTKFGLEKNKAELTIDVPEEAFYLSGLQVAKKAVTSDLQKYFPDLDTISFREVFKRTTPKTETEPPTETPGPAKPAEKTEEKQILAEPEKPPSTRATAKNTRGKTTNLEGSGEASHDGIGKPAIV